MDDVIGLLVPDSGEKPTARSLWLAEASVLIEEALDRTA
jgi:hypothetical protein